MPSDLLLKKLPEYSCITLIGMPGIGKTTLGVALAKALAFVHLDSDYIIEALYSVKLQDIADVLSKEAFLDLEGEVIQSLRVKRTVISTGGSVIYRAQAMEYLKQLGPVIYLSGALSLILERVARNPERGIAIAPGQTLEDLYKERISLYEKYADFTLEIDDKTTPNKCVEKIIEYYS